MTHCLCPPLSFFKAIARSKCVFHESHRCNLSVFITLHQIENELTDDDPQGSRATDEAAKDRYIFSSGEKSLDLEDCLGLYVSDGGKGIHDSLGAGRDIREHSRSKLVR